jgi:flagellar hook protein FlgE
MKSMFSGVSGLRSHQTRMDVIGNNIANVNTVAFKSGRVTFQEIFSQTLKGAGSPDLTTGRGGTNPMQVGLGMGVAAVDTMMSRGSVQRTDNPTDISIEGSGFFILQGGSADTYSFSRAGNFSIDKQGNLVSGSGLNVMGWQNYTKDPTTGSDTFDTSRPLEALNLYSDASNGNKRIIPAKATANAVFAGNLDATEPVIAVPSATNSQLTVPVSVYDALGNNYKVNMNFWKTAATTGAGGNTTWTWEIDGGAAAAASGGTGTPKTTGTITFDTAGKFVSTTPAPVKITMTPTSTAVGLAPFDIDFDLSKASMYASDSSLKPSLIDGYTTGNMVTFTIGSNGILTGIYSNGQQQSLGMVGVANFENPAGLQKVGDNLFMPTTNSGDFKKAIKPGSEGVGMLNPGTLEMSNVDLSREFTEMIVTQRGFQANSRIITTTDEMLQELVNLKR